MTEKEKMISGRLYNSADKELGTLRTNAHNLCKDYNDTYESERVKRREILQRLLPNSSQNIYLQGPIQFDYGIFTSFGEKCYANFNLVILDCCPIKIGNNVLFGPNCSLVTPIHPIFPDERKVRTAPDGSWYDYEYAKPIEIGNDCWLATNVTVCGGVKIGNGCIIGAGSVVTKDIPDNSFAAGNPCRVIRQITEKDRVKHKNIGNIPE